MKVMHAQSKKNRVVSKHGRVNILTNTEVTGEQHRLLKDFFTSAIELSWFWTFFSFCTSFYISWIMFAVLWYLIALVHGDMAADKSEDHVDCVDNVGSFTSAFLFSLETQHTIGWEYKPERELWSEARV